jgi:RNA polymerase sigma-70 factor (sigma-E family)
VRGQGTRLLRVAFLLTGDLSAADDLTQESLAKLLVVWDRVRTHDNVLAYARRVMVNTHRSRSRRFWSREHPTDALPEVAVDDGAESRAAREELREGLLRLSRGQRAAVVLRYFEQLSEAETAAALGCSVGAVKSQTSRGLRRLRELLSGADAQAMTARVEGGAA